MCKQRHQIITRFEWGIIRIIHLIVYADVVLGCPANCPPVGHLTTDDGVGETTSWICMQRVSVISDYGEGEGGRRVSRTRVANSLQTFCVNLWHRKP